MGPRTLAFGIAAAALLTVSPASAATSTKTGLRLRPRLEARCQALLGSAARRAHNRTRREQRLYWIDESEGSVTVAHSTDSWSRPLRLRVRGMRVLRVQGRGDQRRALVRLDAAAARTVGCSAGNYVVQVDDNLGPLRVLALLGDALLVEHGQRLAYLQRPGTAQPHFVLAWGSRYRVIVSASAGSSSPAFKPRWHHSPWRRRIIRGRPVWVRHGALIR